MELLVGAFVAVGLFAIVLRLLPRSQAGAVVLPRIVDESIGMWLLRKVTRRPLGSGSAASAAGAAGHPPGAAPGSSAAESPATPPTWSIHSDRVLLPTRVVVSSRAARTSPLVEVGAARVDLAASAAVAAGSAHRPALGRTAPAGADGGSFWDPWLNRFAVLLGSLLAIVAGVTVIAFSLMPPSPTPGVVLGAVGTPDPSVNQTVASELAAAPTVSIAPSLVPDPTRAAAADPTAVATASPAPTPAPTPRRTPRPTPRATPEPTPIPTPIPTSVPTPTPKATPKPTPKPTPRPTPTPAPFAVASCTTGSLLSVSFDGSGSIVHGTAHYAWDFGDGFSSAASTNPRASHTYVVPGSYIVHLTVSDGGGTSTDTATCQAAP